MPPNNDRVWGYVPVPSESDEVASILIYRDGRPIKIIRPDGRVEPFASPTGPAISEGRDLSHRPTLCALAATEAEDCGRP